MSILVLGSYVQAHCLNVEHLPAPGESLAAESLLSEHGGKGFNVGVGLHRLGAEVSLLLPLGRDAAADSASRCLMAEGMNVDWLLRIGDQSGFGVGFIGPSGENFLAVYPGANALLDAGHVRQAIVALPGLALMYAQFEIQDAPIRAGFEIARQRGMATMLNPSPWRALDPEILALTDILVLNQTEAAHLFNLNNDGIEPAQCLLELATRAKRIGWSGKLLIVTLGDQGCVALSDGRVCRQAAWPIVAADTTGAGDAFNAGLAIGWLETHRAEDALLKASACGAWVAARPGVLKSLPTGAQIERFIATNPIPINQLVRPNF
ncbi:MULTISPECIES: ribokinase [Methylomonas]|uniref:Ribokinase n=1 Tax=Methylomonas koyamae TaxID=702114 RepID=A0A177NBS4_9GAMM|nr:ribokinase [Methylomonas koyamae]OAI14893.1 hypothetical protein A1355_11475 [Methylomonas koyamae]